MAKQQQEQSRIARYLFAAVVPMMAVVCAYLTILSIKGSSLHGIIGFGVGVLYFGAFAIQDFRGKVGDIPTRGRY